MLVFQFQRDIFASNLEAGGIIYCNGNKMLVFQNGL